MDYSVADRSKGHGRPIVVVWRRWDLLIDIPVAVRFRDATSWRLVTGPELANPDSIRQWSGNEVPSVWAGLSIQRNDLERVKRWTE